MFGSISFIFLFLPILVMIYYLASDKYKNFVLSLASIAFYFMLSPKYLAVMLVSIFFDFAMSFAMKSANQNMKKRAIPLLGSIVKNVVLIAGVVYVCKQAETALPVGIFIYTFTAMGYIIDVYEGEVPYENNIIDFTLFCCFFGKLVFGPIITYKEFLASSTAKKHDIKTISKGGVLFIQGVAKLEIISQSMFGIYIDFKEICLENRTIFASWGLIFCLSMAVYYMLSGYCDIARGTAKLFGFELQENMVYPYTSPSVKEFFATFNKSVAAFFGKYVFLPLGGAKRGVVYSTFNILLMCMLWGVWFGFDINFALWGIYIGIFICFEQFYFGDVLKKLPEFVGKFYSRIVILLSFGVFGGKTIQEIGMNFWGLFDFKTFAFYNNQTLYTFVLSIFPTILSLIFITKVPEKIGSLFRNKIPKISEVLATIVYVCVLFFTMGYILY